MWSNTLHFAGVLTDQDEAGAIAGAIGDFYAELVDSLATDWTLSKIAIGQAGFGASFEYATDVQGTSSGLPIPNDCAACVTFTTATPGRIGRGRIFMGGWTVNTLIRLDGTGATVFNDGHANAIGVAVVGNLMDNEFIPDLIVYSKPAPDRGRPTATESEVLGGSVARRIATQRRRDMDTPRAGNTFG